MDVAHAELILYVESQSDARDFYAALLDRSPSLDVPGMTEFSLGPAVTLGLMPSAGIARIVSPPLPHPSKGAGMPRCEVYLRVGDVDEAYARALGAGARAVSAPAWRAWGERVGYVADSDGHVLAFAAQTSTAGE